MTKGDELKRTLEAKADIADKDRKQRDIESKRKMVTDIIGAVTSPLGKVGSSMIGKGAKTASKYIINDASWYKKWVESYARFTNYPTFNNMRAYVPSLGKIGYDSSDTVTSMLSTPGVMEVEYLPVLGYCHNRTGSPLIPDVVPINVALARSISQIRKSSGRSASYNPDVLGLYWFSAIEIAQFLADLKCALELVLLYQANNTYLPDALLNAKGWNPSFVKSNRAELIKIYSQYATRFNSNIAIPSDLSILQRRIWLPSVILKDADLKRAQFYVFHQSQIGTLRTDETGVDFVWDSNVKASIATIVAYLEAAFMVLEESVTMVALVSDIRSGIPSSKFAKLPTEIGNEPPIFGASHEVLLQVHNIKPMPTAVASNSALCAIKTTGTYIYNTIGTTGMSHTFANANHASAFRRLANAVRDTVAVDSYSDDLSADDLLVATRFTASFNTEIDSNDNKQVNYSLYNCGTEVCNRIKIWCNNNLTNTLVYYDYGLFMLTLGIESLFALSAFDWAPVLYAFSTGGSDIYTRSFAPIGELGNAFVMQDESVREIHRMCVSSEGYLDDSTFTASFGKPY